MRLSKLVGRRIKEVPRDAQITSHILMIRGGYIRPLSTGIYSLLPLGKRIASKVEKIVREEMDHIEGQESLMPVVMPAELWRETGRYDSVGAELLRFQDRNDKDMVLGMTHEEAFTSIARNELVSYKQLPVMMYQIQTKYRDEARPRAGLIRVREFTMKDAYSFHTSQECLDAFYDRAHKAYARIFDRIGMNDVISIKADSGMMGGSVSHEFMALADCGEDVLFLSPDGSSYKVNREIAVSGIKFEKEDAKKLTEVFTPESEKIEEVTATLGAEPKDAAKCVCYADTEGHLYMVLIRGDFEVNENKLKKLLQRNDLTFASDSQITSVGGVAGYVSPLGLDLEQFTVIADKSVAESSNLIVGANKKGYHVTNFNFDRDLETENCTVSDIHLVRAGDPCPVTGEPLREARGIEVGNIFQLGTKYSDAMNCTYLNVNGKSASMIMGCYGIGIGRGIASVIEGSHDDYGPIWPISIAPYQVHICAMNYKKEEVKTVAEEVYKALLSQGIEVLIDDRNEKAGSMFKDADLIGVPHRIVISPKGLKEGQVEYKSRDGKVAEVLSVDVIVEEVVKRVQADLAKFAFKGE